MERSRWHFRANLEVFCAAASVVGLLVAAPVVAAESEDASKAESVDDTARPGPAPEEASKPPEELGLTGDWGGLRSKLIDSGVTIGLTEISEILGNVSGGQRQGFDYMGRTELAVDFDLDKLVGWQGALIHANGYQIHGRGLAANNLGGNILGPSNIEATRTTRLFDAYLQQSLFDDKLSVRLGQIAADDEFITSQYSSNFINSTFGWPGIMAADLPSGGPAYPLATPGIRVKYSPSQNFYWQTAVTNGDPAGSPVGNPNPQIRNRAGLTFSTDQDALIISEIGYSIPADKEAGTLPATFKLGGWYHTGKFDDLRHDANGGLQAVSGDEAQQHRGNYSLYAVVDQMLIPKADTEDQGLAGFARIGGSPGDRNLVSFYFDTGLTYKGPFEGRENDIAGIAFSFAKVGGSAIDFDKDYNLANPTATRPVRDYEAVVEVSYQYAATPWWIVQPDIQYVIHPAGNAASPTADPAVSASAMDNAFILGARTVIKF